MRRLLLVTSTARLPTVADLPDSGALLLQAREENFTVAGRLLGGGVRRDLMALYGYARLVDDVGDEAGGDRLALLDVVEAELDTVYAGATPEHPVMVELARTVRGRSLPDRPLRRLIEANRIDQTVTRYDTWAQLLGYCELSANPVGELVLHVFGAASPERVTLSDRVCAGLQVAEHLGDLAEDLARGRVYVPQEDLERFGVAPGAVGDAGDPRTRSLIAFEAGRARALLRGGAPLARTLPWRARVAVAGFVAGGRAALDGLPGGGRDDGRGTPRPRARAFAPALLRALAGR